MKEIIEKARELAKKETSGDFGPFMDLANDKGQELAEKLGANKDIVLLGTLFMDIKRKQAVAENRVEAHVKMSLDVTKEFLKSFDLDKETKNKIYNCVEAHHRDVPFSCTEAEIVANADCYKFIWVKSFVQYFFYAKSERDFNDLLNFIETKINDKWKNISLGICKEELEPHYKLVKEMIEKLKER